MAVVPVAEHAFGPGMRIARYRADNGLTLLVLVDASAPVLCFQTWYGVGSRHEREGKTGIAHLFEHLMFNETKNLPYGEFDRRLEAVGAESNAATYLDWTFYTVSCPADALALVVELESERMENLVLSEEQLEREREVVANERRQTVDDDVDGSVSELLYHQAFSEHGYRWPTVGFMADIEALTLGDIRAFYANYYAPNRATLAVVGDVQEADLVALVQARYGHIPAAPRVAEVERPEPAQKAERRARLTKPAATAKLALGYRSPAAGDADHPPLVLLNEVLFGGRSSRVHRRLVEELEIASDVHGSVGHFRDPGLYDIALTARAGIGHDALGAALDALLDEAARVPVSEAELARAKARVELGTLQGLETVSGRAEQIGFSELVLGDPGALFARLDAYRSAAVDDLLRVARHTLDRRSRTVVELVPEDGATP